MASSFQATAARTCAFLALLALGVGCTCDRGTSIIDDDDAGDIEPELDAAATAEPDAFVIAPDAFTPPDDEGVPDAPSQWSMGDTGPGCSTEGMMCTPVADGCGTTEQCDDGIDNDCDRSVDEGCACLPGTVQPCFAGPPGARAVGACQDGTQRCEGTGEFGQWGDCVGGISPLAEQCDGLDNDCNGCADEHECCGGELTCPGPGDPRIPTGRPFQTLTVDGTRFWSGNALQWTWTITGGPCDERLPSPTFSATGTDSPFLTFRPTLSGDYTVTLTVVDTQGMTRSCVFVIHIEGDGLRVELCWRPAVDNNQSDLDLYLHDPRNNGDWFNSVAPVTQTGVVNANSCHWGNCAPSLRATGLSRADFGYAPSQLDLCDQGPSGSLWRSMNLCPNPRIDVDGHGRMAEPSHGYIENINLDRPRDGETFRVLVHDCNGPASNPILNVYCGGRLRASIGAGSDLVRMPGGRTCSVTDTSWRAADVTVAVDSTGVTTDCTVAPLRDPTTSTGFWFTTSNTGY